MLKNFKISNMQTKVRRVSQVRRSVLTLSAVGMMVVGASQAVELVSWDFSGVTPAPVGDPANIPDNVQASTSLPLSFDVNTSLMVRGPKTQEGAAGIEYTGAVAASTSPAFPETQYYFEFTITPQAGVIYSISDVTLQLTGQITEWWIYSSKGPWLPDLTSPNPGDPVWNDAAASYLSYLPPDPIVPIYPTYAVQPDGGVQTPDRSGKYVAGFNNLTGPVSFRAYGFTGNEAEEGGVVSFKINGNLGATAVPETFPMWSVGLLFAGLVAARSVESRRRALARARA